MYLRQQRGLVGALHVELARAGLQDVAIAASEDNTIKMAGRTWREMGDETMSLVKQVNVHGYGEVLGDREFLQERARTEGKKLWMSEYSDGDRWWLGQGHESNGMNMALCINYDFVYLGMSSWSYWQILDETA